MYKKLIFVVSVLFPCAVAAGKEIKVVAPDAGWAPLWISSLWKRPQSPEPAAMYSSTDISSDEKKRTKKDFFSDPLPAPRPGYSARTPRATRKHSARVWRFLMLLILEKCTKIKRAHGLKENPFTGP